MKYPRLINDTVTSFGLIDDKKHATKTLMNSDLRDKFTWISHLNCNTVVFWVSFDNLANFIYSFAMPTSFVKIPQI